jgi:glycosyltransferase involved in cell wall biosynthesis
MGEVVFISICIPAFGRTEYLKRLLDSINLQTYPHFEVVITDDSPGSELKELAEQHPLSPKIRYYKNQTNLGTPENWNEGMRKAKYDWIKIMHDDDWFTGPASLGKFAGIIQQGEHALCFSAYSNVFPDGQTKPVHISDRQLNALKLNPRKLLAANRVGPPSVVIFRKDISILFDNRMQWLVDIDFYIRYLTIHPSSFYIDENLVQIGISESQVTRSSFGNHEIEIPERFLLAEKLNPESLKDMVIYDSWWRFIRNMKIRDEKEIPENGYHGTIPETIRSMIRFQKKIPSFILKTGLFSKLLMWIQYQMFRIDFQRHLKSSR